MSHALEQKEIDQECFNCSSLLAFKAARAQLSICFPISLSYIHLTASLCLCPAGCFQEILLKQAGNSINEAKGILTSNATLHILCDNVTSNASGTGVICNSASIAPHFLLARLQNYSFQLVIQLACAAYTLQLPSI